MTSFFYAITPDKVLDAVESSGLVCTGRCMSLNSFENRVYDVELEDTEENQKMELPLNSVRTRRVAKFYRPGRWSEAQILEEHTFLNDLLASEIPAIAPLPFPDGRTLHQDKESGIYYAVFPKVGGRAPDELTDEQLRRIGRLLARIHNVGAAKDAPNRMRITPETYGLQNLEFLKKGRFIPLEFESRYEDAVHKLCEKMKPWFQSVATHRLHGDCHLGNLLSNDMGYFFLDFDDMVVGPAAQDLWLLLGGRDEEAQRQMRALLEGYTEMRDFDVATLRLVEPLRALRFIHYTAWVARRWEDPAFPAAFPQFGSHRYWSDQTDDLESQLRIILESEV